MVLLARSAERERMPQIESLAQHSLTDLRRIVAALAPAELEGSALAAAIERMLDTLHADTDIDATLQAGSALPTLPTPIEVVFLRVAQSALANVRQHANARTVSVELEMHDSHARLVVTDDGIGFVPDAAATPAVSTSYGLVAMRSRLREFGGELTVRSAPGEGTVLTASVPVGGASGEQRP